MNNFCIVTTINQPTKAIEKLHELFGDNLIIVADEKTPNDWEYKDVKPIVVDDKLYSPSNHYARKNAGYLEAMKKGAELIYSTDDDNLPNENWVVRNINATASQSVGKGWFNVYKVFSEYNIWPRGFSLRHLNRNVSVTDYAEIKRSSIQQGLADGEPDVDAIWRLVFNSRHEFKKNGSVYLNNGSWCPFNSQSTWFFKKAFPLMYLPVCASFRMCDIFGSLVAQKCLWELDDGVVFHSPSEVFQDRNEHDLIKDFSDEISGYLHNDEIVETLKKIKLKQGEENICDNMIACYQAIVDKGILPQTEIRSLKKWIKDYEIIS